MEQNGTLRDGDPSTSPVELSEASNHMKCGAWLNTYSSASCSGAYDFHSQMFNNPNIAEPRQHNKMSDKLSLRTWTSIWHLVLKLSRTCGRILQPAEKASYVRNSGFRSNKTGKAPIICVWAKLFSAPWLDCLRFSIHITGLRWQSTSGNSGRPVSHNYPFGSGPRTACTQQAATSSADYAAHFSDTPRLARWFRSSICWKLAQNWHRSGAAA